MVALTKGRDTRQRAGDIEDGPLAAGEMIYPGALIMRNAAGSLAAGAVSANSVGVGRAEEAVDNTGGGDGDAVLRYAPGIFNYANSTGADLIEAGDVGTACWIVDDQTVAKTSAAASRSVAGIIHRVEGALVWVRFDEALARLAS